MTAYSRVAAVGPRCHDSGEQRRLRRAHSMFGAWPAAKPNRRLGRADRGGSDAAGTAGPGPAPTVRTGRAVAAGLPTPVRFRAGVFGRIPPGGRAGPPDSPAGIRRHTAPHRQFSEGPRRLAPTFPAQSLQVDQRHPIWNGAETGDPGRAGGRPWLGRSPEAGPFRSTDVGRALRGAGHGGVTVLAGP
jgi:hypothetical protein